MGVYDPSASLAVPQIDRLRDHYIDFVLVPPPGERPPFRPVLRNEPNQTTYHSIYSLVLGHGRQDGGGTYRRHPASKNPNSNRIWYRKGQNTGQRAVPPSDTQSSACCSFPPFRQPWAVIRSRHGFRPTRRSSERLYNPTPIPGVAAVLFLKQGICGARTGLSHPVRSATRASQVPEWPAQRHCPPAQSHPPCRTGR